MHTDTFSDPLGQSNVCRGYDNDGDLSLAIVFLNGPLRLYENCGADGFVDSDTIVCRKIADFTVQPSFTLRVNGSSGQFTGFFEEYSYLAIYNLHRVAPRAISKAKVFLFH